jgi:hypothetical protein
LPCVFVASDHEAQEFCLRGRCHWSRRTEGSLSLAVDAFTQALVHDPEYAQAYAGLAECCDVMPEFTSTPRSEAFPRTAPEPRRRRTPRLRYFFSPRVGVQRRPAEKVGW